MPARLRVALLIDSTRVYGRNVLQGIAAYARAFGPWTFFFHERALDSPIPRQLKQWRPDGIITRVAGNTASAAVRYGAPVVVLGRQKHPRVVAEVVPDNAHIARLAAQHLFEDCGLREFAYLGFPGLMFSEERRTAFTDDLHARGCRVHLLDKPIFGARGNIPIMESSAMNRLRDLSLWLQKLPKPIGLMAATDVLGYQVVTACGDLGIAVPAEIAVVGVDNDPVVCGMTVPSLSSINSDSELVGYHAARLLHEAIAGGPVSAGTASDASREQQHLRIAPAGVVARGSTEFLAASDPDVRQVIQFVRDHACNGLTVEQIAQRMELSRSTLDRWFDEHVGHSVKDEISRRQVLRAQELLRTTDLKLEEVARLSGFQHVETLHRLFKRSTGISPGTYRLGRG